MTQKPHRFRFRRAGGFDQVVLDRAEDLRALRDLDPKLWVALACPVAGLEFDEKTLSLIDTDGDGRIRAPEILAAVEWACTALRDPGLLVEGGEEIPLDAIAEETEPGAQVLSSARQILRELGRGEATAISLADAADTARLYAQMKLNGDGVVPPTSAGDAETARAIEEIVSCTGGTADRCGERGVSRADLDAFFEAAEALDRWWKEAESEPSILPLGERTAAAAAAVAAVRDKVNDWFTRCRLAAFDPRAAGPLNRSEEEYAQVASALLSPSGDEVASFPLARVEAGAALPLTGGINPAWIDRIEALRRDAIEPLLGPRDRLALEEWRDLQERLAPFERWLAEKKGEAVERLGLSRVRELLAGGMRERIAALVEADLALAPKVEGIAQVERLLRYKRDLYRLLRNFVSFADFYGGQKAIFQAGTLYLDQRSFDLCIRVEDPEAHAVLASKANTCLAYCECVRKSDGRKMYIVAAVTGGKLGGVAVGRNGVFFDRKGVDWDARVVKVVEYPVSVREAFWLPYRRIGALIGEQIEKFAAARDREIHEKAAAQIEAKAQAATVGPAAAAGNGAAPLAPPFDVARFAGIFAALGLAVGAIGSAFAALASGFLQLTWWQMPLALIGLPLAISGPAMIMAWLKLRGRSLGPLLDATGWAVNSRARINIPFGASLTSLATLPRGSVRTLGPDPWAPRRTGLVTAAALVLVVLALLAVFAALGGLGEPWIGSLTE